MHAGIAPPLLRHPGVDRLKICLTGLVLLHHAAMTYGGAPGWFWQAPSASGTPTAQVLSILVLVNQTFFMGLFFLIAGAHVPAALRRSPAHAYAAERALRLGLPSLLFAIALGPITVALASTSAGYTIGGTLNWAWQTRATYPGPMWFALALLGMSLVASALRGTLIAAAASRPFPSNGALWQGVLACGVLAFMLRLAWPVGEAVWGFQFGHFASYLLLFGAGIHAARHGIRRTRASGRSGEDGTQSFGPSLFTVTPMKIGAHSTRSVLQGSGPRFSSG